MHLKQKKRKHFSFNERPSNKLKFVVKGEHLPSFSENFFRHRFLSSLKSAFDQLFGPSSQKRYKNEDRYSKRHSHLSRHVMRVCL